VSSNSKKPPRLISNYNPLQSFNGSNNNTCPIPMYIQTPNTKHKSKLKSQTGLTTKTKNKTKKKKKKKKKKNKKTTQVQIRKKKRKKMKKFISDSDVYGPKPNRSRINLNLIMACSFFKNTRHNHYPRGNQQLNKTKERNQTNQIKILSKQEMTHFTCYQRHFPLAFPSLFVLSLLFSFRFFYFRFELS